MYRVAINGVAGRMGRELVTAVARRDDLKLTAAFDAPDGATIGQDAGRLAGGEDAGVCVTESASMNDAEFDVVIDFSSPAACVEAVERAIEKNAAIVIGTTGLSADQQAVIDRSAQRVSIVQAPNYSAGVNLSLDLLRTAARVLGDSVDIEIIEGHHRNKVDAPSGTALKMGEVVAETTGRDLEHDAVYARQGHTGVRDRRSIGFQTIRGGDIVGEHTVLFAGDGERIEITHKASSRQTFAGGAARAAAWAAGQSPGHYDMADVLELRIGD
ncbi:4-hydroxy-tetrahydrodipicolinate reductase [Salinisphaera sp. USBA-960]|uniref:4-hydroxy-tetrahydrodipicolinate reductase n=1 Tax=Salinisphaera orenii TaxID=856731 RepID=UPI000DBE2040|nr:4-hydroxy-tetrahydrodipicolinate reductase [Salifodinibacter halophilus]NNC25518.1 4-hydroxy-tetrahydrodipicolinate reductase [Salifodinibacter halophilus]